MKKTNKIVLMFGMVLAAAVLLTAGVSADNFTQKTYLSTKEPIQIPGRTLPPGDYVLMLLEHNADRNIVQVMTSDEMHVLATIIAIPDERLDKPENTEFTYYEMPAGTSPVLREWFYPGSTHGLEFVYTGEEARQIAAATQEQVPYVSEGLATKMVEIAPRPDFSTASGRITAPIATAPPAQPAVQEEAKASEPPAPVTTEEQPVPAPAPAPETPKELPRTASPVPLAGLAGLFFLAAGLAFRLFRQS